MPSSDPSHPNFDPSLLPKLAVIRCPLEIEGSTEQKLFVVIGHKNGFCICVKATSNVLRLKNSGLSSGVVLYAANEIGFFNQETAIQPDNQFPILHTKIKKYQREGKFSVLGEMPPGFIQKLEKAIQSSKVMSLVKQQRILGVLRS